MSSTGLDDAIISLRSWTDGHVFTSNIIWCEEKYAVISWVAEFWNAFTNVPFVSVGVFGLYRSIQIDLPLRFLLCYFFLCLIGIGSFFFHATLRYEFQILDEFPMLLLAAQSIFSLAAHRMVPIRVKLFTAIAIYSAVALSMILYVAFNVAVLFQILFGFHMAAIVVMSYRIYRHAPNNGNGGVSLGNCMFRALAINSLAFFLWLIDRHGCESLRYARKFIGQPWDSALQLHAWWHLLTAMGLIWFIAGLVIADPFFSPRYRVKAYMKVFPLIYKTKIAFQRQESMESLLTADRSDRDTVVVSDK